MNRRSSSLKAVLALLPLLGAGHAQAADLGRARVGAVPVAHPVVLSHAAPPIAMKPVIYRPIVADAVLFRPILTPPTGYFHPQAVTQVHPVGACPVSTPVQRCR